MNRLNSFLSGQRAGARIGLVVGALAIVAGTAVAGYFLMRTDYQVLFSDLSPQDVAAMTGELDKLKVPYVIGDSGDAHGDAAGGTILVDRNDVYRTRIKLMSKDIPLHGAIGFELFNNSDLGMTEFAQKINFQRALQGELTRTILSLQEVRDVRVLLALPEQGLFKQAATKPTASITLALKPNQRLRAEQVSGIQRLVASAVPNIHAEDVTIVDQSGVALSRAAADGVDTDAASSSHLDLKQDTENYLARKANAVLERALGPGAVTTSVDVTLNMDRVQTNTDEVLGVPGKAGGGVTGVVAKERESEHDSGAPLKPAGATGASGSNQHEVEYALGRRVEQVVHQPGTIKHLQVAVVVRRTLTQAQLEQLRETVGAAVGASFERGDTVVVQSTDGFQGSTHAAAVVAGNPMPDATAVEPVIASDKASQPALATARNASGNWLLLLAAFAGIMLLALLAGALMRRGPADTRARLSPRERQEALLKLRGWLAEGDSTADAMPGVRR